MKAMPFRVALPLNCNFAMLSTLAGVQLVKRNSNRTSVVQDVTSNVRVTAHATLCGKQQNNVYRALILIAVDVLIVRTIKYLLRLILWIAFSLKQVSVMQLTCVNARIVSQN
jgi:hypothetical protein